MANVVYTLDHRCNGGGHTVLAVSLDGTALGNFTYTTDEISASLASLTPEDRQFAALIILKLHMRGKTRAQMVTEFGAGPITVTI